MLGNEEAGDQVSEQELEVTETELDKSQDAAVEAAEESEAVSAAPESDVTDEAVATEAEAADDTDADEADADVLAAAAAKADVDPADEFKAKLRRQEGDWYVIHSYAGYENRVKANLETRIQTLDM